MFLFIRMALYLLFGVLAGQGIGVFDETSGAFTVQVDHLSTLLAGLLGFAVTFATSRIAKAHGGKT